MDVPGPDALMPETPTRDARSDRSAREISRQNMTSFENQIAQIESMALQHYPDDGQAREAYKVQMLMQRLREMHAMFARLPVREMTHEG
jgi:hypothetical protein